LPIQNDHGSICLCKVKKEVWFHIKHIGIQFNPTLGWLLKRHFGIPKSRWKIILKKVDVPLHHLPNIITTCICLHNLIIHGDNFDMIDWAKGTQEEMQNEANDILSDFHKMDMFWVEEHAIKQLRWLWHPTQGSQFAWMSQKS
jgi:hypothetical protein